MTIEGYSISPMQRRTWNWRQKGDILGNSAVLFWEGPLDRALLEKGIVELSAAHSALRTSFKTPGHQTLPLQVMNDDCNFSWKSEGVYHWNEDQLLERARDLARTAHDYSCRIRHFYHGQDQHLLVISLDPMISDGWSLGLFIEGLFSVYNGTWEAGECREFVEYSGWLEELEEDDEEGGVWWDEQLRTLGPPPELPMVGTSDVFEPDWLSISLSAGLMGKLQAFAENMDIEMELPVTAAWAAVLARISGATSLPLDIGTSGRSFEELLETLGPFQRFLPCQLEPKSSFSDFCRDLSAQTETLDQWQHFHGLGHAERETTHFSAFECYPFPSRFEAANYKVSVRPYAISSPHPLSLILLAGEEPQLSLRFNRAAIKREDANLLLQGCITLLEAGLSQPDRPMVQLPLLDKSLRHEVLYNFNGDCLTDAPERLIHHLFEEQVQKGGERTALVYGTWRLSYDQLNRCANRLAHRMIAAGAEPGQLTALSFHRCAELVVAILAILKTGGAYLPADPDQPPSRLRDILSSGQSPLILTQADLDLPPLQRTVMPVALDELLQVPEPDHNPAISMDPIYPAYAVFTSGSTGKPKGVLVRHENLSHYLRGIIRRLAPEKYQRFAVVSSFAADLGNTSIFPALCLGGALHVIDDETIGAAEAFASYMTDHHIEWLKITPSHLNALLSAPQHNPLPARVLILGGEASSWTLIEKIAEMAPHLTIYNHYGPCETTVGVLTHVYEGVRDGDVFPIGRPLPGSQVYLTDGFLEPVVPGQWGEIFIGGGNVTSGYLGQPAMTAERFIPNPFSNVPGALLYRTGDLARYNHQGVIRFGGRADHQVKVRGYRVELGEIESALRACETVSHAAVTLRKRDDQVQILAWYVPASKDEDMAGLLRKKLEETLPSFMMPHAFLERDAMPLNANGKLDRGVLEAQADEALEQQGLAEGTAFEPLANSTEKILGDIWRDVLGLEKIGANDHFFNIGGHSLNGTIALSRTNEFFNVQMRLIDLFTNPTARTFAAMIHKTAFEKADASELEKTLTQLNHAGARPADLSTEDQARVITVLAGLNPKAGIRALPRHGGIQLFPLSFTQRQIWTHDQMQGGSRAFNRPMPLIFRGALNLEALQSAVNTMVERHETLRTSFPLVDGAPAQQVHPFKPTPLLLTDFSEKGDLEERRNLARALVTEISSQLFNLLEDVMVRFHVIRIDAEEHIFLTTMHHIISDLWSLGVAVGELGGLYTSYCKGEQPVLKALPIQYADYASWQSENLNAEDQLNYWRQSLADAPDLLELPTDRPRPATVRTTNGAQFDFQISSQLNHRLNAFCSERNATLFMGLHAAFSMVLARYSGQSQIVVGSPLANRTRIETEGLIGCFINMLPLHLTVNERQGFAALLEHAREVNLGAQDNQHIPFEEMVAEFNVPRSNAWHPIFQVSLVLQNAPSKAVALPDLDVDLMGTEQQGTGYDLVMRMVELGGGLDVKLEYNGDLFDHNTIERLCRHFVTFLESGLNSPQKPLLELEGMGDEERQQILHSWNQTETPYSWSGGFHHRFGAFARENPDAPAIVEHDGQTFTYGQLDAWSDLIAMELLDYGAAPENMVGVFAPHSPEAVAGFLGTLKAGCVYLPLAHDMPLDRVDYIMDDADVYLVLAHPDYEDAIPARMGLMVIPLEPPMDAPAPVESWPMLHPQQLAYVIYTSGSTGRPKGVSLSHGGLVNLACLQQQKLTVKPDSRVLLFASLSFDASVWEFAMGLGNGACLVLSGVVELLPGHALSELLEAESVTHFSVASSALGFMPGLPPCLETLVAYGETPRREVVDRFSSGRRLFNAYGPTETTVCSTMGVCQADDRITIGRPIPNFQNYIMDHGFNPSFMKVPGEFCLGGAGLARGYLGKPALTAASFTPHPFSSKPGERLYRTGDLARMLEDGRIEFIGRRDTQVKLRGFRIELGEVENVLLSLSLFREVVVLLREDTPNNPYLAAYLIFSDNMMIDVAGLRNLLEAMLPAYMIPSQFVFLEKMPTTFSGKIDRKALPAPDRQHQVRFEPPIGEVETLVAGIFSEILDVKTVGRNDNFLEIGGQSLLAILALTRIRDVFGCEISIADFFSNPVVEDLAKLIGATASQAPEIPEIPVGDRSGSVPLSFAQERLWFLNQFEGKSGAYNLPAALNLNGPLDVPALFGAFRDVAERHEVLRSIFPLQDGVPVQIVQPGLDSSAFCYINLLGLDQSPKIASSLALRESRRPFDLEKGPSLRVYLVSLQAERHLLLLTMHHIVADGWSSGVLFKDWQLFYEARRTGTFAEPEPLPIQYGDVAIWQREQLAGSGLLSNQLSYWLRKLEGCAPLLELPYDKPRPSLQTFNGRSCPVNLGPRLTRSLSAFCSETGTTPFMALQAIFAALLHRYTHEEDILIGTPVAGRNRREFETMIGCFINNLTIRNDLSGQPGFRLLTTRVRATVLEAFNHQDLPFEQIIEAVAPQRNPAHSPIFQVMFLFQNTPGPGAQAGDLALSPVKTDDRVAKFDLSLALIQSEESIHGSFSYNTDLFEEGTIAALNNHFIKLLDSALSEPDRPLHTFQLMDDVALARLEAMNNTLAILPQSLGVHRLFEDQARKNGDRVAIIGATLANPSDWESPCSYDAFNKRANKLAGYLRQQGVGPETRVAIFMHRRIETIMALLAVTKAGGAYVPLDPQYPADRLAYILEDCGAGWVLTQNALIEQLPHTSALCLCLETLEDRLRSYSDEDLPYDAHPEQLIYLLYTSGSTGRPKAVGITHHNVSDFVNWAGRHFSSQELAGVLFSTSLNFDLSVFENQATLCNGGTCILAENILHLPSHPARDRITLVNNVPTPMAEVVALNGIPNSVKTVTLCGEPLEGALVDSLEKQTAVERIINLYGPTEDTVFSTMCQVTGSGTPPIGKPMDNTAVHILDPSFQLALPGCFGELCLSGDSLARGYMGRPRETALRFTPNPFDDQPGGRLYRTGDLARLGAGDLLHFHGRIDTQIKLRGYRIELGEIESLLAGHEKVGEQMVTVHMEGISRMIAWVQPVDMQGDVSDILTGDQRLPALRDQLIAYLSHRLPAYMVPSQFVFMSALPRTPNGKLNRNQLPEPPQPGRGGPGALPETGLQSRVTRLWEELLEQRPIYLDDNFFELGGHSLTAVRLLDRFDREFSQSLPMADFFKNPTIRALCRYLEDGGGKSAWTPLTPIRTTGALPPVFFMPPAGGTVFFLEELHEHLDARRPIYGFESPGLYGDRAPLQHIEEMAALFVQSIMEVQPEGPYILAGYSLGGIVAYEAGQQLRERGHQDVGLILIDAAAPNYQGETQVPDAVDEARRLSDQIRLFARDGQLPFELDETFLAGMDREHMLAHILEQGKETGLLPRDMSTSRMLAWWEVFKTNSLAIYNYKVKPIPGGLKLLRAEKNSDDQPFLGWDLHLDKNQLQVFSIPGEHRTLLSPGYRTRLAAALNQAIAACHEHDFPNSGE